jgi:hypothetical protein
MKPTNLVIAALLLAPLAARHAQTVPLKLSDLGRRVEIDRSALLRLRHQGHAAAVYVSAFRVRRKNERRRSFSSKERNDSPLS